jgi:hypothetical protein
MSHFARYTILDNEATDNSILVNVLGLSRFHPIGHSYKLATTNSQSLVF